MMDTEWAVYLDEIRPTLDRQFNVMTQSPNYTEVLPALLPSEKQRYFDLIEVNRRTQGGAAFAPPFDRDAAYMHFHTIIGPSSTWELRCSPSLDAFGSLVPQQENVSHRLLYPAPFSEQLQLPLR